MLQVQLESCQAYRHYLNVVFDAIVQGTSTKHIRTAFSLLSGIPLTREGVETVEDVAQSKSTWQVITDQHVYTFGPEAAVTAQPGDVLHVGDTMTSDLEFFEFHRGRMEDIEGVTHLATGPALLSFGFSGDIVWENKELPLIVEEGVDGRTRVSWQLQGWPGDAEKLFDELHRRGIESGKTLANYLDIRENPEEEPGASNLPATVNPFELLTFNLFRKFAMLVRLRSGRTGFKPLGLHAGTVLRKIIPPHTAVLLQVQLDSKEGPVMMGASGGPSPSATETASTFVGNAVQESMDSSRITDSARIYQVQGNCV